MPSVPLKTLLVLGTVREGRMGDRVGKWMQAELKEAGHEVILIDPLEIDLPLLKQPIHFIEKYDGPEKVPANLKQLKEKIESADAFVFVTAEYNRTLPPALTNFMDHFPPTLFHHRPSAIVSYSIGSQGGMAANMALRGFLCEFGCAPIPINCAIGDVSSNINEEGNVSEDRLKDKGKKMVDQLGWYAKALKEAKTKKEVPQLNGPVGS